MAGSGDTTNPGAAEAGVGRLTSRLMEALTSLCQAGEKFVDSTAENGQRMIGMEDPAGIRGGVLAGIIADQRPGAWSARPGETATGRGAKSPPGKMERMKLMKSVKGAELWTAASSPAAPRGA